MLSFADLAARPGFTVRTVTCQHDGRNWSEVESQGNYRVVLVRHGRFRRRVGGVDAELDPTMAYVGAPGEEEHFAHPVGGDVCTAVTLTPELWRALAGETARLARSTVYIDPAIDLTHRRFYAAARTGDVDYALAEQLTGLLGRVVDQVVAGPTPVSKRPARSDHALVVAARRAIVDGHPAAVGLLPLAELLGVSPYRLSRAFSQEVGVTLTRYRNRVRVMRALERLEQGEPSLAVLAADLGFADQAHLCRTMTEHLGHTPAAVRRLLSQPA